MILTFGALLAHDHRSELAVIADEDELLCPQDDGDHALGLGGLHGLVDEDGGEAHLGEPRVARADAGARDDVGHLQELALGLLPQRAETLLVVRGELAGLVLELLQLAQLAGARKRKKIV